MLVASVTTMGMCEFTSFLPPDSIPNNSSYEQPAHWRKTPSNTLQTTSSPSHHHQQQEASNTDKRFSSFVSDQKLEELSKGLVIPNTSKSTSWAVKTFEAWRNARNANFPEDSPIPENILECADKAVLNCTLAKFVVEARKTTGEPYPPKTIHFLMCGLLRHMRSVNAQCPNFLNKKDPEFNSLHGVMDVHFHKLHSDGYGCDVKHAKVLSKEDEQRLWAKGVMGTATPKSLQNAAFYIAGKMFSLRGGAELRNLKPFSTIKTKGSESIYIPGAHIKNTKWNIQKTAYKQKNCTHL